MENNFYKNAYYLMISKGYHDSDLDNALLNLLIIVLKKKNYGTIESYNTLVEDFRSIIGFELPYFPMKKIVSLAAKQGYINVVSESNSLVPDYTKVTQANCMQEISNRNKAIEELKNSFMNFLDKNSITYKHEEISNMIDCFIEDQGAFFYKGRNLDLKNNRNDFFFAKFLTEPGNSKYYTLLDELISGRILSELMLHEDGVDPENRKIHNTTVYLDADIIFMLLGIDELGRKEIYTRLVQDMLALGIKVKVFRHTCEEVARSIASSIKWINNPEYEEFRATKTTSFFVNHGISSEKIENLYLTLEKELEKYDIEIEDMAYPKIPEGKLCQQDYYSAIKEYYLDRDPFLDENELKSTIDNDAQSFLYVCAKNGFNEASRFSGISNIFITNNSSLPKVARQTLSNKKNVPFCFTDTFFGALIWKDNPIMFEEQSRQNLANFIYQAFLPTKAMSKKFSEIVDKAMDGNEISEEECILLKRNKLVSTMVLELSNGDIDYIDEKMPQEILKNIRKKSFAEGVQSEREKASIELESKDKIIKTQNRENISLNIDLNNQKKSNSQLKLEALTTEKMDMENKRKRVKVLLRIVSLLLGLILVAVCIIASVSAFKIFSNDQNEKSKIINYLFCVLGILPTPAAVILVLIFGKSINIAKSIETINGVITQKLFAHFNCTNEQLSDIEYKIKLETEMMKTLDETNNKLRAPLTLS